jgi:PAS domain S-box-containing protein
MNEQIKILMVEDSPSDAKLIQRELRKENTVFVTTVVETKEAFIEAIRDFAPDAILCDHSLPGFNSMDALVVAKQYAKDTPFILVTGSVSEEYAVSSIKAGAHDYILKTNLARLPIAIVSALKQKERELLLRKSEAQFQHTIDRMIDGVQIISFDWRYLYVNDTVASHGKVLKEEMLGRTMMERYPGIENTKMFKMLETCMNERVLMEMENEFKYPDGTTGWFKLSIQPAPEGILILSRDISDKKLAMQRLEEQNEELRKINAELDRFVYSASHEMRAPLCTVLGLNSLAKVQKEESQRQDLFTKIDSCVSRLDDIIHDIVHFSRNSRMEVEKNRIDFKLLFDQSISQCRDVEGVEKVTSAIIVNGDAPFYSDISRLEILMKNILSNSIKYQDVKQKNPYVKVAVNITTDAADIEISDNGIGIPEKYMDDIFKMFYRATEAKSGTGLGLYIVREIVEKLGGTIRVQSVAGAGTTFFISLPNASVAVAN